MCALARLAAGCWMLLSQCLSQDEGVLLQGFEAKRFTTFAEAWILTLTSLSDGASTDIDVPSLWLVSEATSRPEPLYKSLIDDYWAQVGANCDLPVPAVAGILVVYNYTFSFGV